MLKMKRNHNMFSMVQAITVLTILKMLANAQTQCNGGLGRLVYERLPDHQLQGFDDEMIHDSSPPFRVLEKCQDLCLRDRTVTNLPRTCTSFDFQPGARLSSFGSTAEYEESRCYLTREQAQPEGIGNLMLVPNSIHFVEICLTSNRVERDCPNRRYIFERHPRKKLKLPVTDVKEVNAANRTACEDKCLNEFSFVCRSATYDSSMRSCLLSRFTRRTHPELLEDDANSDYLENTCLTAESRCDGLAVFVKEENKKLRGPFEVDIYANLTLDECQALCLRAEKYMCRSVEYDDQTRQCVISEEDSVSQKDDIGISSSPTYHFYDLVCLDNPRGSEYPDNSVASHLYPDGRRPDTAFQRYRNSRLSGDAHSEITGRSLSECLEDCLRQTSFQCRSAVYSEHNRVCRLSSFNQRDGHRIIYDADYDYYENLMHQYMEGDRDNPSYRPDPVGQDTNYGRPFLGRPGYPADDYDKGYSGGHSDRDRDRDRYPNDHYPADRYPKYPNHYPPEDRYPERYPASGDRYPYTEDRYPLGGTRGDRYPVNGDNYPTMGAPGYHSRYPPTSNRYPPNSGSRYPSLSYPTRDDPYPSHAGRYPPTEDHPLSRYPGPGGRIPPGRYPPGDRYPDKDIYPNRDRYPSLGGNSLYPSGYEDDVRGTKGYGERPYYGGSGAPIPAPIPALPVRPIGAGGYENGPTSMDGFPADTDPYNNNINNNNNNNNNRPVGGGPIIGRPPLLSRCDEQENFRQVGQRTRVRKPFVRRYTTSSNLAECERECADARDFVCRSFNYRSYAAPYGAERDNCELSDRDSRDMAMGNPIYYDSGSDYDFYERNSARQGVDGECLDVSQVCSEDGMEFTLRTPDGFIGRIYTYGYYDRCFFRGNGGTVNVLRISGAQGYPECGTQRYGDTMTNIVVVQFSDYVQTGRDKRFNLTCLFRGPGEAVVTSGYIGAGRSGSPIPIEYLPAENTLSSKVRLSILYQGRPTTTIAVGDPLTFKLESQDGYNYVTDIFATNVIARDPYSGRSVQLIDRYGCPVDNYVFPGLDRLREGDSLEARFNAFKIPESNFLVFEATVRSCRDGCQPAYCSGSAGRSEPSFGKRRRRSLDGSGLITSSSAKNDTQSTGESNDEDEENKETEEKEEEQEEEKEEEEEEEHVREMFEVLDSRYDMYEDNIIQKQVAAAVESICITPNEYYGLVTAVVGLVILLSSVVFLTLLIYRKYGYSVIRKNRSVDKIINHGINGDSCSTRVNNFSFMRSGLQKPFHTSSLSQLFGHELSTSTAMEGAVGLTVGQRNGFDPSEPIYTDPSLFEVSNDTLRHMKLSRNDNLHLI